MFLFPRKTNLYRAHFDVVAFKSHVETYVKYKTHYSTEKTFPAILLKCTKYPTYNIRHAVVSRRGFFFWVFCFTFWCLTLPSPVLFSLVKFKVVDVHSFRTHTHTHTHESHLFSTQYKIHVEGVETILFFIAVGRGEGRPRRRIRRGRFVVRSR